MTNADVPTIAVGNVIENPVNPFTGISINSNEKYAHDQYVTTSQNWNVDENRGNMFLPSEWFTVHDNIFDLENWQYIGEH